MPLEIRQIGIRMEVGAGSGPGPAGDDGGQGSGPSALLQAHDSDDEGGRADLIEQCVAAVLDELARRAER